MRCSAAFARVFAYPILLLLALAPAAAHAAKKTSGTVATDAYAVTAPPEPWLREAKFDPPGQLTWTAGDETTSWWLMRVAMEGVESRDARAAIAGVLAREKILIRGPVDENDRLGRGEFEPDSIVAGKMTWHGFRVSLRAPGRSGISYRWVALHPDFPARRRAFVLAFDEGGAEGTSAPSRAADARTFAASLVPHGVGLAGGIESAYLDGRVATFAARIDSATRLCWRGRGADAGPNRKYLGLGIAMAIEGDFHEVTGVMMPDSLVDPGAADYGTMFDRNADGRVDLLVLNQGITPAKGPVVLPIVTVLADDNFDGQIDGSVFENGDTDGDGRADHRTLVMDTNYDGRPDRAVRFTDAIAQGTSEKSWIVGSQVVDRIVGNTATKLDIDVPWRTANSQLEELTRARADCVKSQTK